MKQKKNTRAEIDTTDDKRILRTMFFIELLFLALTMGGIYGIGMLRKEPFEQILSHLVTGLLGLAVMGVCIRREFTTGRMPEENSRHFGRFYVGFLVSMVLSFACGFLPVEGWPFVPVFVLLALYSTPVVGMVSAVMLLMISTITAGAAVSVFFLYLVSGVLAVCLFCPLGEDVKIGIPLTLSMLCLFTCETAGIILTANARPSLELFLIPIANIVISTVLLLGIIKLFSGQVVYRYRERYLELNDTENPILAEYRQNAREEYMKCIHTAYFCERIAGWLSLDCDALKCAGYYHIKAVQQPELMEEGMFPPSARRILEEYIAVKGKEEKNGVRKKETAVLLCSDMVVGTMLQLLEKERNCVLDHDKIIDAVFRHFADKGTFDNCEISLQEYKLMQKIFKEEKLYYDFLR